MKTLLSCTLGVMAALTFAGGIAVLSGGRR